MRHEPRAILADHVRQQHLRVERNETRLREGGGNRRPDVIRGRARRMRVTTAAAVNGIPFGGEEPQPPVVVVAPADILEPRLHQHALRRLVAAMRDADDPVETEIVEAVIRHRLRALGGEAAAPGCVQKTIADLDVRRLARVLEREPADEGAGIAARRAPDAEVRIQRRIAQDARQQPRPPGRESTACRCRRISSRADRCRGGRDRRNPRRQNRGTRDEASRAMAPERISSFISRRPMPRAARPDVPARAPS